MYVVLSRKRGYLNTNFLVRNSQQKRISQKIWTKDVRANKKKLRYNVYAYNIFYTGTHEEFKY